MEVMLQEKQKNFNWNNPFDFGLVTGETFINYLKDVLKDW